MPIMVDRSNFDLKIQGKTYLIENNKEEPLLKFKKKKKGIYWYVGIGLGVVFNSIHGNTISTNLTRWSTANSLGKQPS